MDVYPIGALIIGCTGDCESLCIIIEPNLLTTIIPPPVSVKTASLNETDLMALITDFNRRSGSL